VHHEATHDAPNFACDSCLSVFDDAEQLSVHVNDGCSLADSSTDIGRRHVCGTCGEVFRFVRELYKHYSECHMNDRSSSPSGSKSDIADDASMCANCGAVFSGAASLKVHLWKAHSLNFAQQQDHILSVASRDSDTASTYRQLLVTSDKDRPFKCSMCNWSFKYDFSFHAHLKMHEQKQRVLNEMLHTNCKAQQILVTNNASLVDVGSENLAWSTGEHHLPVILCPLKRKLQISDSADCLPAVKLTAVCGTKFSGSSHCLATNPDVKADVTRQTVSEATSSQQPVDQSSWEPVRVSQVSCEQLHQTPSISSSNVSTCRSVIEQSVGAYAEQPLQFACKLCSFKCHYDFSYIAHLNQHEKLKELEIDDLQSHLVAASSTQMPSNSHIANKFAIKVISTDDGDVSYVKGHTEMADSSGISYILLCSGSVEQSALVTGLTKEPQYEGDTVVTQPATAADVTECIDSNAVFANDVSTNVDQDLDSTMRPVTTDDNGNVDFSVGPEMQFLDLDSGETLYVINESNLQVALPVEMTSECQDNVVCEETETEVVSSPQPSDGQMLDVTSLCGDEDGCSDAESDSAVTGESSYQCYYCNAMFTNISHLQQHIARLHVE